MAGGLLALLDDVAVLAKAAMSSLDDVAAGAAKAGAKSAGVIIDDAAVTPQYVSGISPKRELPIIWRITKGSLINKFLIVIPVAMILSWLAPQLLPVILIIGGTYLCFEGAEKVLEWFGVHVHKNHGTGDAEHSQEPAVSSKEAEDKIVRAATTTDLVLSAEIMFIAMSGIETDNWIMRLMILGIVAVLMTVLVYGAVSLLIKVDDTGLHLASNDKLPAWVRKSGRGMVKGMPGVFRVIGVVGTIAMLWVGGHILAKSLSDLGLTFFYDRLHDVSVFLEPAGGFIVWTADTIISAVIGILWGLLVIPLIMGISVLWGKVLKPVFMKKHSPNIKDMTNTADNVSASPALIQDDTQPV